MRFASKMFAASQESIIDIFCNFPCFARNFNHSPPDLRLHCSLPPRCSWGRGWRRRAWWGSSRPRQTAAWGAAGPTSDTQQGWFSTLGDTLSSNSNYKHITISLIVSSTSKVMDHPSSFSISIQSASQATTTSDSREQKRSTVTPDEDGTWNENTVVKYTTTSKTRALVLHR